MPRAPLTVAGWMTPSPYTIDPGATLDDAHHLMRDHRIRHLPVVARGDLVGVVSLEDLHLMETLKGVDPDTVEVAEAMSRDTVAVAPDAPLADVVARMIDDRRGSVVVLDGGKVVGVFTTVDALQALRDLLRAGAPGAPRRRPGRRRR